MNWPFSEPVPAAAIATTVLLAAPRLDRIRRGFSVHVPLRPRDGSWKLVSHRETARRAVVHFCYEAFFKRRIVSIDLANYTARVESARSRLEGTEALRLLDNYFDPEKKLLQVYEGVRDSLTSRFVSPDIVDLPTDEDLQACAGVIMADIHRRAEIYLLGKLG